MCTGSLAFGAAAGVDELGASAAACVSVAAACAGTGDQPAAGATGTAAHAFSGAVDGSFGVGRNGAGNDSSADALAFGALVEAGCGIRASSLTMRATG